MNKRNAIILAVVVSVIVIGSGVGIGIYFWLNPLGGANQNLSSGTIIASGTFVEMDSNHWGTGPVSIVELADNSIELQFDGIEIANGPDLYIYLSDKANFTSISASSGNIIDLGLLPYNVGKFSVDIPGTFNATTMKSVLIWCLQFTVVFTYATLNEV